MTKQLLIQTLNHHGVAAVDNDYFVNVKEEYTINGQPGHDWRVFYPEHWTMRELLHYLGY